MKYTSSRNYLLSNIVFAAITLIFCTGTALAAPRKVGLTLPLSGGLSAYGDAFRRGLELYQEENPDSSAKVQFTLDDSQYDGSKVAASVRKLTTVDKVELLYVWGVTPSQVAAPIAQQAGVPLLAMTVDPVSKDRPLVASLQLPIESLKTTILQFLRASKISRTGVIGTEVGAVTPLLELLRPELPGLSFYELVPTGTFDFRSLVTKIRSKPVDAIVLMVTPEQILPLVRQLAQQKVTTRIIGGDMLADESLQREILPLISEVSYVYGEVDPLFRERYEARVKNTSHLYEAAAGYSAGILLTQMIERLDSATRERFMSSLVGKQYTTPIGEVFFASTEELGIHSLLKAKIYSLGEKGGL